MAKTYTHLQLRQALDTSFGNAQITGLHIGEGSAPEPEITVEKNDTDNWVVGGGDAKIAACIDYGLRQTFQNQQQNIEQDDTGFPKYDDGDAYDTWMNDYSQIAQNAISAVSDKMQSQKMFGGCLTADNIEGWAAVADAAGSLAPDLYADASFATYLEADLLEEGNTEGAAWVGLVEDLSSTSVSVSTIQDQWSEYSYDPCAKGSTISSTDLCQKIQDIIEASFISQIEQYADDVAATDAGHSLDMMVDGDGAIDALENDRKAKRDKYRGVSETLRQEIEFKEQCFLLANIFYLAQIKVGLDESTAEGEGKQFPDNTAKGNRCVLVHGDPFGLINTLTQSPSKETFFEMHGSALSALQPMIRLHKVILDTTDSEDHKEKELEMKFDTHYTPEDITDFMNTREMRGHGVGIKSFDFAYEAENPYAIKKSIRAKLVLFANSFSELTKERTGTTLDGKTATYSYIDLALKTGGSYEQMADAVEAVNPKEREVVLDNLSKLLFRLKANVGWALPTNQASLPAGHTISGTLLNSIYDSAISLNLTPTVHTFDFDDMGRVTFTINYLAYVEDYFDQPNFNVFSDTSITTSQIVRKLAYKKMNEECKAEQVSDLKNDETIKKQIDKEKEDGMKNVIMNLLGAGKIRYLTIALADLENYRLDGPFAQIDKKYLEQLTGRIQVAPKENTPAGVKDELQADPPPEDTDDDGTNKTDGSPPQPINPIETISFFYVADLVDSILKSIGTTLVDLQEELAGDPTSHGIKSSWVSKEELLKEVDNYKRYEENFKRMRIMLGPLEIINSTSKGSFIESEMVNLGDLPVSVKYFMEWMTEKVLKRDKAEWPLPVFLNAFFNEFIRDFLNSDVCYDNRAKQKTRLSQNAITSYTNDKDDEITYWCKQTGRHRLEVDRIAQRPILNVMGERGGPRPSLGIENEINYLTYFASRTQPTDIMRGCKGGAYHTCYDNPPGSEEPTPIPGDHDRGIWHYQIGKDTGIVKTITLSKTDSPGLAEVRFEQEGYDGLRQLRVLYDAKIKTYLDVNSFPGCYIFIEPRGFDPAADQEELSSLGVGGYYMIIRSAHTLGQGVSETEITAKWVAEIDPEGDDDEEEGQKSKKQQPKKCYAASGDTTRKESANLVDSVLGWVGGILADINPLADDETGVWVGLSADKGDEHEEGDE